jgi:hypothetical protein
MSRKILNSLVAIILLIVVENSLNVLAAQQPDETIQRVEIFQLFEIALENNRKYYDPFRDVELLLELRSPDGNKLLHYGFYDGENIWKIRFSPDKKGVWTYSAWFSDHTPGITGAFIGIETDKPGRVWKNGSNPFWLGKAGSPKTLFRSLHVGDRFFATNWDDPSDTDDGNLRSQFLDWFQDNEYNMLSIASHYLNRQMEGRGEGWETPRLWPLDPSEYRKMEIILDDLYERDITVFPFAGFFGMEGNWPIDPLEQELYIKYTLARIGHYPNIIFSVAGPEPLFLPKRYKGAMRMEDIIRLGSLIDSLDVHNHILTVHNQTQKTRYGDIWKAEPWYTMSTLQGPKTAADRDLLYSGLSTNRLRNKPVYAQETLWAGNMYHPEYPDDVIRKNTYTILFAGAILNFADNDGNSSSGFSGTLDLNSRHQHKHDIVHRVWDWFETIPFHRMTSRQDLVRGGFCLAEEGKRYYVYLGTIGKVTLHLDFPYMFRSEWINAKDPLDIRQGPSVNTNTTFDSPSDGDDWILHVYASNE